MYCRQASSYRAGCLTLDQLLKDKCRFVLKLSAVDAELTHAQLMKIRCGGILGMQHVLGLATQHPPRVLALLAEVEQQFGDPQRMPFDGVVKYVQSFRFRRKRSDPA
jgi:hypothetical protein